MTQEFTLLRGAHVDVRGIVNAKKQHEAEIIIDGKFSHRFSPKSRVSKHLDVMTPKDLAERLTGGSYFLIDDKLVDFRDGSYNGFIHTDQSVGKFMDILGFQERSQLGALHRRKRPADDDVGGDYVLRKVWSDHGIKVPGYDEGGDFTSQLSFVWNPYVRTINSAYDLVRLICTNGAIGLTSFLNSKIPLVNRWEEHLDIASRQIQNKVSSVVIDRVQAMGTERASVGDCLLLEQHVFDRLHSAGTKSQNEREMLLNLLAVVSPKAHLNGVYKDGVFGDKTLAAQLPSHLTAFDAYNIATEVRTHSADSKKSSDNALDRFANGLLFDREDNFGAAAARLSAPKLSAFSDPNAAFFGHIS
jgi:hypothetical protein